MDHGLDIPDKGSLRLKGEKVSRNLGRLLPRPYGLRGKLIIPYVLLTLLLAMIGTYVVTHLVASSIRERFVNQLYESSRVAGDSIVRSERSHLENLRLMAFTLGVPEAMVQSDSQALEDLLLPLVLNEELDIFTAIDTLGIEVLTLGRDPESGVYLKSQGVDFSSIEFVQNVLTGYTDELGDKFAGLLETKYGTALLTSAPVWDESGSLVGVLLAGTRIENLLLNTKSQSLADIVILDEGHKLVMTTLAYSPEAYQTLEDAVAPFMGLEDPGPQEFHLFNRQFQVFYTPFIIRTHELGWLGVILPSSYVVSTEATSRNTFSFLFALGTTATIFIGFMLSQSIAKPILKLRTLSQAVAAGDFNQSIGLKQSDEIGELADAFDVMTVHLKERTEEAERLYAETAQRNKELAEINTKLQATQSQLVQSEKLAAIGQLTAGIVHDVKNPLTVIKGMAELLQEEEILSDESMHGLGLIRESAIKANQIVTDLLTFARQSSPVMCKQDLRETIQASLRLTAYLIRKNHIEVETNLPEQAVFTKYDTQQIEQVFINLITNAVQAMTDSGRLFIQLTLKDQHAAITFQDTGSGIPPDIINRVFDPFFTTKPEGEGTGLGLSVSYGIIASHHGYIDVESQPGEGTTFTVLLPVEGPESIGEAT